MIDPGVGGAYFGFGELGKLADPDCRGAEYLKHLAKCLPSKPPGEPPEGPTPQHRPIYDPPVQPVGFFDLDNPITDVALLGAGGLARGGELGIEGAVKGGKWALKGAGDLLGGAADDLGGLVGL